MSRQTPPSDMERRALAGNALMRATSLALQCNDLEQAGRIIYYACKDFLGASAGYVALIDGEHSEQALVVDADGLQPEVSGPFAMPPGALVERACREKRPVTENDYAATEFSRTLPAEHRALKNILAAPLILDGRVVGMMALVNKPDDFDETDREFAAAFGEIMAVALASIRMRDDLEKANRVHRLLFEGARDAIFWADAETGIMIDCNAAGERLLGRRRAEIVGMHQSEIHPARDAFLYRERFAESALTDAMTPWEAEVLRADGEVVAVEISTSVVDVGASRVVQCIFRDIRSRKADQDEIDRHRHRLAELTAELSRSAESQRRHVAVELHDGLAQELAAMKMLMQDLTSSCEPSQRPKADRLVALVDHCIASVRGLTNELSPAVLYEIGLASALGWLAESYSERFGLMCALQIDPAIDGMKGERSTLTFRIARELLMNVHRHAGTDRARLRATLLDDTIVLNVDDEGRGFDPLHVTTIDGMHGFGLFSIREEVRLAGGTVEIDSREARGTHVDVRIPLEADGVVLDRSHDDARTQKMRR